MEKFYKKSTSFYDNEYDPHFNTEHFSRYASKRWQALNKIISDDNNQFKIDKILDLGCGEGNFTNFIYNQTKKEVIGVDASKRCCELASKNYPNVKIIQGDCEDLTFKDNIFDIVFTNALLHHVRDIEKTIIESLRVIKKDGYAVYIEPNRFNPLQILHGLASKHERGTLKFSINRIKLFLSQNETLEEFWIKPINTYLYVRKKFPPKIIRDYFIFLEDFFEYNYLCTHYMIVIRK